MAGFKKLKLRAFKLSVTMFLIENSEIYRYFNELFVEQMWLLRLSLTRGNVYYHKPDTT